MEASTTTCMRLKAYKKTLSNKKMKPTYRNTACTQGKVELDLHASEPDGLSQQGAGCQKLRRQNLTLSSIGCTVSCRRPTRNEAATACYVINPWKARSLRSLHVWSAIWRFGQLRHRLLSTEAIAHDARHPQPPDVHQESRNLHY